jgi:protein arginine phosphatase
MGESGVESGVRPADVFRVLFVCSGNTCRSPLAEALARRELEARELDSWIQVSSAGTGASLGAPASEGSIAAAASVELDLAGHRSRPLSAELVAESDLILTMGVSHLVRALELGGAGKAALIAGFAEGREDGLGPSVPDPFGGNLNDYLEMLRALEELVHQSIARLEHQLTDESDA